MAEIRNDLTWSVSRSQQFISCPRGYYYTYYGSWGGWSPQAEPRTRLIYILKNMKTLLLWAGTIVHDTIKENLSEMKEWGHVPELEAMKAQAIQKMRNGWVESVNREWLSHPKKTNLLELYYGNGEEYGTCRQLPKALTDDVKQRVMDCIEGFHFSPAVKALTTVPASRWKPIDTLDFFMLDEIKVWCAPDFAYEDDQGIFHILDWKTGGENRATISQQLACYAMFATSKWKIPLERIKIHGVFLKDGGRTQEYEINDSILENTRHLIRKSFDEMKSKIADPDNNLAKEADFAPRPSEGKCMNCPYRRLCMEAVE